MFVIGIVDDGVRTAWHCTGTTSKRKPDITHGMERARHFRSRESAARWLSRLDTVFKEPNAHYEIFEVKP